MSSDEIDAFASMFDGPPKNRTAVREARAKKERQTQQTDKQRQRTAVRTAQINFRCTPEFKERVQGLQGHLGKGWSIADILEEALALYAPTKNYKG